MCAKKFHPLTGSREI